MDELIAHLETMQHGGIQNYIAPGLASYLIATGPRGLVRMFDSTRETEFFVTPHSHGYDFVCLVLEGVANNTIYTEEGSLHSYLNYDSDDLYGVLIVKGTLGSYEMTPRDEPLRFYKRCTQYKAGEVYAMKHDEIHSITFSKGAKILFFEGPPHSEGQLRQVRVLQPWVNGAMVPTFSVPEWMYK
jgi:hypothetical protein